MKITIKGLLGEPPMTLDCEPSNTIYDIKTMIQKKKKKKKGIPRKRQRLIIFGNYDLEDGCILSDYDIHLA
eukprot:gene2465-4785_t